MLQRYKKVDEICVFNGYKKYTFLHFSVQKQCVIYYKSARYKIITHFYTLVYIRAFIIVFEQLRHYFLSKSQIFFLLIISDFGNLLVKLLAPEVLKSFIPSVDFILETR